MVKQCIPTGGQGSGTYDLQRALVWSVLDWAAEQGLPADSTHPVILRHLSDRTRDAPRLLNGWQRGKRNAGTFVKAGRLPHR